MTEWFGIDTALVLLNRAEKIGEGVTTFKGYGRNPRVFAAKVVRTPTEMKVFIDNKFKKSCTLESQVIDLLVEEAEKF